MYHDQYILPALSLCNTAKIFLLKTYTEIQLENCELKSIYSLQLPKSVLSDTF